MPKFKGFNMHRRISYSTKEFYCRYLDLGLNSEPVQRMCSGNFFTFLNKELGLKKLPYDIKLIDLIIEHRISVDLFVELPKSYFESWENFPNLGYKRNIDLPSDIEDAGYYNVIVINQNETSLSELSHPYDESLNEQFKKRFEIEAPSKIIKYSHTNGRSYYPYEAYLCYWKAYIILEAVNECLLIDRYISKEEGSEVFKDKVLSINNKWMETYAPTFDAISHYRTFTSMSHHLNTPLVQTYGEISQHLLNRTNVKASELNTGLGLLLELHNDWIRKLKHNGMVELNLALKSLKRDIYFLFEWLCCLDFNEKDLFKQWSYKDSEAALWSQLQDVVDFEEISFRITFERYIPIYCKKEPTWFGLGRVNEIYDQLNKHQSFEPWIRSFSDLHKSINKTSDITLVQPRVLDTLLVMTIRTEVLIRTMLLELSGKTEPDDFKDVIRELSVLLIDDSAKKVLIAVADNSELAGLRERPELVFNKIENSNIGKKWSKKHKYFFKVILKFIASRNYFAHHYYKDHEFVTRNTDICREVLISCLQTILFINDSIKH